MPGLNIKQDKKEIPPSALVVKSMYRSQDQFFCVRSCTYILGLKLNPVCATATLRSVCSPPPPPKS
jgi:hypothetical protein